MWLKEEIDSLKKPLSCPDYPNGARRPTYFYRGLSLSNTEADREKRYFHIKK